MSRDDYFGDYFGMLAMFILEMNKIKIELSLEYPAEEMSPARVLRGYKSARKTLRRDAPQIFEPVLLDHMELWAVRLELAFWKLILPFNEDRVTPEFIAPDDFLSDSI